MAKILASVRIVKFTSRGQLKTATRHALRQDKASQRRLRPGAKLGTALAFTTRRDDAARRDDFEAMRDVLKAYDAQRTRLGIAETKQGGMGFHALVCLSPEWVADAGDPHDRANPRNRAMILQAVRWLESWCGIGSVYACRIDLDEEGAGVVDAFVMPARIDGRTGRLTISTSKVLAEISKAHDGIRSFAALQTSWAKHCQQHLDGEIQRGRSKAETRAEHLAVDEFKDAASEASRRVRDILDELQMTVDKLKQMDLTVEERRTVDAAIAAANSRQI